jgi:hypothetical protein
MISIGGMRPINVLSRSGWSHRIQNSSSFPEAGQISITIVLHAAAFFHLLPFEIARSLAPAELSYSFHNRCHSFPPVDTRASEAKLGVLPGQFMP